MPEALKQIVAVNAGHPSPPSAIVIEQKAKWHRLVWIRSAPLTTILSLVGAFLLCILDYRTGHEISISAFYLIPICWASWRLGRRTGVFVAISATVGWYVADRLTTSYHESALVPLWNGIMLLALFLVVVWLLCAFQTAHQHLDQIVQQRTAALEAEIAERKRLEIVKVQAERLATVGTMAAQVAHEIRNPLGSIQLNLDLIQKEIKKISEVPGFPTDEGITLVNDMRAEVDRIQRVLEDYLRFARLPKPHRKPLVLNDFLVQKLAFMGCVFDEARVTLQTQLDPTLENISADPEQLWQAILNLIRNAIEAMSNGGELTVCTWLEGRQARLRVADNGKGIDAEQLKMIFTPFFTTKRAGTGLGLSLVQQIVTEHGGHVGCESIVGKGTTFTLFLPLGNES